MLPRNHPDRIQITFDDRRLVANAGLILPATLALHLGLPQLVDRRLDLGDAPGRANPGDKISTLVASALAGGDSPLTIDLDSTICETYGLDKEGARHHGYTGARGYHPLLAVAAGTGDVLVARLREDRANTACGAAHFLRETVGRVRYGGARGQLTVRADSGFYTHSVVAVCRKLDVRFSITIRQHTSLHNLIEAIPGDAWTPIPYWMDGADVAEITYIGRLRSPGELLYTMLRLVIVRIRYGMLLLLSIYSNHITYYVWLKTSETGSTPPSRVSRTMSRTGTASGG